MHTLGGIKLTKGVIKSDQAVAAGGADIRVMAVVVDHSRKAAQGVARIVDERIGDVTVAGYLDHSRLCAVRRTTAGRWEVGDQLVIAGAETIIRSIQPADTVFLGLEDPEMLTAPGQPTHLFFTLPFSGAGGNRSFLGHAKGTGGRFVMRPPVLTPIATRDSDGFLYHRSFKELCPAPANSRGTSYHLVESWNIRHGVSYSTVALVEAKDLDSRWTFLGDAIHPADVKRAYRDFAAGSNAYEWCSEHVSPCRLMPSSFVAAGRYRIGILNGRSRTANGVYGRFLPGLFLYDPETGNVPWVDPQPLFDDPAARTILFVSDVLQEAAADDATLITHIDDTYVQHYQVSAELVKERVPREFLTA